MAVKIKPLTSEIIEEIAEKSGIDIRKVREAFHLYWIDIGIAMNRGGGYSIHVENMGTFYLNMRHLSLARELEKRIRKQINSIAVFKTKYEGWDDRKRNVAINKAMKLLNCHISELLILIATLKSYEKEVRESYPKKYKANIKGIEAIMARVQKLFDVPLASLPVTIRYPIQEVHVCKLSKSGFLPNRINKVSKEM